MCAQVGRRPERAAAAAPNVSAGRQASAYPLPLAASALRPAPLPAVYNPMPPAGAALLLADNPPFTHLTNPEPLDGARHEVSAVRVRPRPPTPPLLSRCSCGFALANPPLVSAARSSYKIEARRSLYTFPRCAAVGDGFALPQHDPHPAAGHLARRASVAEDDWSVSGPTLDPLTGRSSCCRLPVRCRRRVRPP